jgi:heat shock protein HslJ
MEHVPDPSLVNILWEWERRDSSPGGSVAIEVIEPEKYSIIFNGDGTFNATLDCNRASGQYATPNPGNIFMELGPMTAAACEPGSLADQMANMFGPAQSYRLEENDQVLVFSWVAGGPVDYYRNAASEPPTGEDAEVPGEEEVQSIPEDAIQMDLQGLADSYNWSIQPGTGIPPGPGGQGFPPHIILTFDGQSPEDAIANGSQRMYIFPTDAYMALYEAQGSSIVADQVTRLQQLIAEADSRQTVPDSPMPLLPPPNSLMNRWAQFLDLDFVDGRGVRYVSEAPNRQDIGAWTNQGTSYYYQGLTPDSTFYVSLVWPVTTESLPNTYEDVPADIQTQATDPNTYDAYLQTTKDTLSALPTSAWSPDLARLDAMIQSLTFVTESESELTGDTWQWLSTTDPVNQTDVADPTSYTILFNEDGSANIKADCNNVGATYTTDGSSISITLGPSTLAACPPGSLDQQFLNGLSNVATYFFQDGDLFMDMFADGGTMRFTVEESIDLPEPVEGEPTGTVIAPDGVFIRTGPGTEYPAIGAAPFGETGLIIGRSEDSQWWVMDAPEAPGGQGWVAAAFIEATNAENVPVVPAPEAGVALTLTTWQWMSLSDPVGETIVNDPSRYTILFNEDGSASIKADCNNVGATYSADGSSITITLGAATLVACPEDSLDQQFLNGLSNVALYFFQDGDLYMDMFADGGTMRFSPLGAAPPTAPPVTTPAPTPNPDSPVGSAQGILFQVVSFGAVGAEQPVLEGTQITATFLAIEVTGSAGCNTYTGALTPVNDYFTIGPVATTQQECTEPAGIMEQEQAYLAALEATNGFLWQSGLVGGTTVITAGQLFYLLPDGTEGIINYIAL